MRVLLWMMGRLATLARESAAPFFVCIPFALRIFVTLAVTVLECKRLHFSKKRKTPEPLILLHFSRVFGVFVIDGRNGARTRQQT